MWSSMTEVLRRMVLTEALRNNQTRDTLCRRRRFAAASFMNLIEVCAFFIYEIFVRRSLKQVRFGRFIDIREVFRENFVEDHFTNCRGDQRFLLRFRKEKSYSIP